MLQNDADWLQFKMKGKLKCCLFKDGRNHEYFIILY